MLRLLGGLISDANASTLNVPGWLAIVPAALGAAGTIAAGVAISRQYAFKASLATLIKANAELRRANDDLRSALDDEKERRANLEGRLAAFTSDLADKLVEAVIRTVERTRPQGGL